MSSVLFNLQPSDGMTYSIALGGKASHCWCRVVSTPRSAKNKTGKIFSVPYFPWTFRKIFFLPWDLFFIFIYNFLDIFAWVWKELFSNGLLGISVLKGYGSKSWLKMQKWPPWKYIAFNPLVSCKDRDQIFKISFRFRLFQYQIGNQVYMEKFNIYRGFNI